MDDQDTLHRFEFENIPIRGEIVKLDATLREVMSRHDYPPVVRDLLGELMVVASLLSATIKYKESLIIQLQGEGPISMVVVECSNQRTLRGLAHWSGDDVAQQSLPDLIGNGRLVITVDPSSNSDRYQGISPIEGDNIAEVFENYLARSEQLRTRLWIAINDNTAAGMLIQKLPDETEFDFEQEDDINDAWDRIEILGTTIKENELLQVPVVKILHRLFHQEDIRLYEPEPVSFRCSCSRERVRGTLRAIGYEEISSILSEREAVGVNCEFCNLYYEFDRIDAEQIFISDISPAVPTTRH
ncbi:MAG: Hsp33 family molecular chaperone HslO [Gammaproteobacteria bacterium]|nr:Hsp33 family molecular chaperone HslO [Gammaproteobacteria bacterium]